MDISNQMQCSQVFNNNLFKRFNYPLNIENSKDITSLGKAKIIFGPYIYSNTNFYKFNKNLFGLNSNSSSSSISQSHSVKKEFNNKNETTDDYEIIFEIIENKKYYFIFPKKSVAESLTITEPYEIIISIESSNTNNNTNNINNNSNNNNNESNQENNILLISGASKLLLDTMNNYFDNYIQNQDFSIINKINIPNKNLVIFNFQSNEFQMKSEVKKDETYKSEMSMPEIIDSSMVQKSTDNNNNDNNNNNTNNINSNSSSNNNISSNNNNNNPNNNNNIYNPMNKLPKKKLSFDKANMDSKHILGKVAKSSKNIMKIPSKYPLNKNPYNKNKNLSSMGSTTISNETTVMTSGQVGSLNSHYQNVSSPLYSLSPPSSSPSNQNNNSSNNSSGTIKCCSYCGCKTTPIWRRGPEGKSTLCNACGVKWKNGKILTNDPPTNTKMNMNNKHGNMGNYDSLSMNKLNNIPSSNFNKK